MRVPYVIRDLRVATGTNDHVTKWAFHTRTDSWSRARAFVAFFLLYAITGYYVYIWLAAFTGDTFRWQAFAPSPERAYAESTAGASAQLAIPTPTPTPTEAQIIMTAKHGDIILRIWTLESSRGEQPLLKCSRQGLVSDMGFDALDGKCFTSVQEEVQTVDAWLDTHLNEHPLANTLCIWNTGVDTGDCAYARNFLGI